MSTIATISAQRPLSWKPLLLAEFTFPNGDILYLSTEGLGTAYTGGFPYAGKVYIPAILNQNLAVSQALSDQGIDRPPTVAIDCADANKALWIQWEDGGGRGFKGAQLTLSLVFWECGTSNFTSDSMLIFNGTCEAPTGDETTFSCSSVSKLNMSRLFVPTLQIQRLCPWSFPTNPGTTNAAWIAVLNAANSNADNISYTCGYCYGIGGAGERGNPDPSMLSAPDPITGTSFTTCNNTKTDCVARGMYTIDNQARQTGHFGGIQWSPQVRWYSRAYGASTFAEGVNNLNEAKYGDYIPAVFGFGWVNCQSMATFGDASSTRAESPVCFGLVSDIILVTVNDVELPGSYTLAGQKLNIVDKLFVFNIINPGNRYGTPNGDIPWNGQGDPYGSICVIEWIVPSSLASSTSLPTVRVLIGGPKVAAFTSQTAFTLVGMPVMANGLPLIGGSLSVADVGPGNNQNPIWVLIEILKRSQWQYSQMLMSSAIKAAAVCDQAINYQDQNGNSAYHQRFKVSLVIIAKTSAAELVRGLRNSANLILFQRNGLLNFGVKGTLADQQPNPIPGSNYSVGIPSIHATGGAWSGGSPAIFDESAGTGYVAFAFDESNIVRLENGVSTMKLLQNNLADSPNSIGFQFQDEDNTWAPDSLNVLDSYDYARVGQEIDNSYPVRGVPNFDQGRRIITVKFSETNRGNNPDDTRGTRMVELRAGPETSHLNIGDIVWLSDFLWNISQQTFRIYSVQPALNMETILFRMAWHEDIWYTDTWGQHPDPPASGNAGQNVLRAPYGWDPFLAQPPVGGSTDYPPSDYNFSVAQSYASSTGSSFVSTLTIAGYLPINRFSTDVTPPFVRQGESAATGGTVVSGIGVYAKICATDAAGGYSAVSGLIRTLIPPGGTMTNLVTIPNLSWSPNTVSWEVYAAPDPNYMTLQNAGSGTPTSITIPALGVRGRAMPDAAFSFFWFRLKYILHSGIFATTIVALTATSITLTNPQAPLGVDYTGYEIAILGLDNNTAALPIASWLVTSTDAETVYFTGASPIALGIKVDDVVVMRCLPIWGNDSIGNYVDDLNWKNRFGPPIPGTTYPIIGGTVPGGGANMAFPYDGGGVWVSTTPYGFIGGHGEPVVVSYLGVYYRSLVTNTGVIPYGNPATWAPCWVSISVPASVGSYIVGDFVVVAGMSYNGVNNTNGIWSIITSDGAGNYQIDVSNLPVGPPHNNGGGGTITRLARGLEQDLTGCILRMISGTGEGYRYTIASNTLTRIRLLGAWIEPPDPGTRYIVEDPVWLQQVQSEHYVVSAPLQLATFRFQLQNFQAATMLVEVAATNAAGVESAYQQNPFREIFLFGQLDAVDAYSVAPVQGGVATIDLSLGSEQEVDVTMDTHISAPINTTGVPSFTVYVMNAGGHAVTFDAAYTGFDPTTIPAGMTSMSFTIKSPSNIFLKYPLSPTGITGNVSSNF